ncbi:MAG: SMP-30/gluconolactonase/LRE family protein [Saprospiraceae bacterium]|nr:SMP-30/gluconolactonase/LRE family protein [Saprospiraceae bacterium]
MSKPEPIFDIVSDHGEGPLWDAHAQLLFWVDIVSSRFIVANPATGVSVEHGVSAHLGAIALCKSPNLILLALRNGFATYDLANTAEQAVLPPCLAAHDDIRFNDGAVCPAGRFFAGTMPYDTHRQVGQLFRLDPNLTWQVASEPYTVCNGIVWTADGLTCYFIDSPQNCVFAFDYDVESGALTNRRVQIQFTDDLIPDGMTRDDADGLWIAFWGLGQVRRYLPDGQLTEVVEVPAQHTTSCCFGGDDLTTLYITTSRMGLSPNQLKQQPLSGRTFFLETAYRGVEEARFAM